MSETAGSDPAADVTELADAVRELKETVAALQGGARPPALPPGPGPDERSSDPHAWLSVLEAPRRRRPTTPRIVLEALFLVACAVAAALADLDGVTIAAVMLGAWALASLAEVAGSRADRARERILFATPPVPVVAQPPVPSDDPAWYSPPVEQTLHDVADVDPTAVTRLPPRVPDLEETQIEQSDVTIEQRPGG